MRTQVIREKTGTARLVHYATDGSEAQETRLESFPFTIGRNETSDLPVDSGRVSRDHAVITCDNGSYRLRDLGSTNGTFLNGRQVRESSLSDGDILVFADTEFAFFSGQSQSVSDTATQVIDPNQTQPGGLLTQTLKHNDCPTSDPNPTDHFSEDWISRLRSQHEQLMRRAIRARFRNIVRLDNAQKIGVEAYELLNDPRVAAPPVTSVAEECQLVGRERWLWRHLALEQAAQWIPQDRFVVLGLQDGELGTRRLLDSISSLASIDSGGHQPVIAIPDAAVSDTSYMIRLHELLRVYGFGIMHHGFNGSGGLLFERSRIKPDFVRLPASMTRGIDLNPQRQHQVRSIVQAAEELDVAVIITEPVAESEIATCREMGCSLADGPWIDMRSCTGYAGVKPSNDADFGNSSGSGSQSGEMPFVEDTSTHLPP